MLISSEREKKERETVLITVVLFVCIKAVLRENDFIVIPE